jgi:hypothetical protein
MEKPSRYEVSNRLVDENGFELRVESMLGTAKSPAVKSQSLYVHDCLLPLKIYHSSSRGGIRREIRPHLSMRIGAPQEFN